MLFSGKSTTFQAMREIILEPKKTACIHRVTYFSILDLEFLI
jgi:hypothetical protein